MVVNLPDEVLYKVEKPARYIGNEMNSVHKEPQSVKIRFAFCFPDVYEVGMSHLGMKILYHMLNEREDTYCERVFAPWTDMEEQMRKRDIPLFALESKEAVTYFDFVGFTLQYEMSFTNIINMLDLAKIPIKATERKEENPFVILGGPCAYNSEPLWEIADIVVLGESEEALNELMDLYIKWKENNKPRKEFLKAASSLKGVYIPAFYDVEYNDDGTIKKLFPIDEAPQTVSKRFIKRLDDSYFPKDIIVPYTEIVHDRIMLEVFRGCTRGCRFCQAGFIYRPVREKSRKKLMSDAASLIENTGYEELSLTSLSICDYSDIKGLVNDLIENYEESKVGISLPSLRIDSFSVDLINEIQKVRKTGLTFAPEAGSQRMRDVINKGVTEEDLMKSTSDAFKLGWSNIKLYFMIGLPGETFEDIEGIAALAYKVMDEYYKVPKEQRKKGLNITVSTSSFVPKAFTPFQWEPQNTMEELKEKQYFLKNKIKSKQITYNWHASPVSFLEGIFARGDRKLSKVLINAWEKGCKFDGWDEHFKFDLWMEAFEECGIDPAFYANRRREYDEILPWDHLNIGIPKEYLINEHKKSMEENLTTDCREGCHSCGILEFEKSGVCFDGALSS
ncbi:radical SAM superfamily protein [Oxobacter pfennigii]|uniref:Radical SAM superfamily protein n=1 Tax=Oxobacter pfennigii TaxID=36849 RepID=A0A0P8W8X2_9CLOT|nr:TIGR03960 family B12-binding radical SAM protein [Oxobacter pfennigii]KPU44169.1 radical SAM superfamily protein [Oxobacter pfennigii]